MKHQKEIITVLPVMTLFLPEERRKRVMTVFRGEFQKIRAPTYEGEVNIGDKAEERLLGMSKYF